MTQLNRRYAVVQWLLFSACVVGLCPDPVRGGDTVTPQTPMESFESEMATIDRVVSMAEAGDVPGAARLLCHGGDPETIGWRALTAAGHLREHNRYVEADRLAQFVLEQPGSALSNPAVLRNRERARYWASRLYLDVLNRPQEAEQVLGTDADADLGDSQVAELRGRAHERATAQRSQEGGQQ